VYTWDAIFAYYSSSGCYFEFEASAIMNLGLVVSCS